MTQYLTTYKPVVAGRNTVNNLPSDGMRALIIGNDSPFNLIATQGGTSNSKTLYPGTADIIYLASGFNGYLDFIATSVLNNNALWPANYIQIDGVGTNEIINESSYPMNFSRAINTGNPPLTVANSVLNTGNTPGTNVLSATPSPDASGGPAASIDNIGNGIFGDLSYPGMVQTFGPLIGNLLKLNITPTGFAGSSSGTWNISEVLQGSGFKILFISQNNFKNGVPTQQYVLQNAYTVGCIGLVTDIAGINFRSGGANQNIRNFTTAGNFSTPNTATSNWCFFDIITPFDTLVSTPSNASAHTGFMFVIGI